MISISSIRSLIQFNVRYSAEIRQRIHASTGRERYDAWVDKRKLGAQTRILLLALAFARGRTYLRAEPFTRTPIHEYALAAACDAPLAEVKAWLEAPVAQKVQVAA